MKEDEGIGYNIISLVSALITKFLITVMWAAGFTTGAGIAVLILWWLKELIWK